MSDTYTDLIELINGSESMNDEERQYWIQILPIMTPPQVQNLREILQNEKKQLADIDRKYSSKTVDTATVEKHRKQRREDRSVQEQDVEDKEEEITQQLLQKIEKL